MDGALQTPERAKAGASDAFRFVIVNTAIVNGGDAAILLALIDIIKSEFGADSRITVIDPAADVAQRYYPDIDIRQSAYQTFRKSGPPRMARAAARLRERKFYLGVEAHKKQSIAGEILLSGNDRDLLKVYQDADLIISTGGTYLVDNYNIAPRLFELEVARRLGKPVVFFTQSLGPFDRSRHRAALKPHFDAAPLILLRDERSRQCLMGMGVDGAKLHVSADGVFGMASEDALAAGSKRENATRRVAISVRNWAFFTQNTAQDGMAIYRRAVAECVEWLVRTFDCEILFISTCQGIEEYRAKDSLVAAEIATLVSPKLQARIRVDHDFHHPVALRELLKGFDLVIATRMHMAILALTAGVPVLPIAYEFKTEELFASLGMGEWVTSIESVGGGALTERLAAFIEALPALKPRLFAAVGRERARAFAAGSLLRNALRVSA